MQAREKHAAGKEQPQEHTGNERAQHIDMANGGIEQADLALVTPGPPPGQLRELHTGLSSGKLPTK